MSNLFYSLFNAALALFNFYGAYYNGNELCKYATGFCAGMSLAFFAEWLSKK